ncbi:MAG TPA: histidine kinase dimerization/phospho-acceptor domain-containing protein, partial [Roseiflexaceae bacterium]|nr:histidine kinase dimerization/phospho-acceptor domain-containing protein [Roseiflexaceae bacterium]
MDSILDQESALAAGDVFAGGGEMGALMREFDWSHTSLGPVASWPQSLRTAVSILLTSRHPMFIFWGSELAKLYNDGYRPILGSTKHPGALGQRGPDIWPEIWDTIGPMVEQVFSSGEATWSDDLLLFMHRNGYLEEVYFTFSYSPIRDETGGVGGMFCACTETTERVLGERRLRALRDMAARASEAKTAAEACRIAAETLALNPADIPFALLYLLDSDGRHAQLVGTAGLEPDSPASPTQVDLRPEQEAPNTWPLARVARAGRAVLVDDVVELFGPLLVGPWPESPHSALVLPVARPGQALLAGLLVVGISPRRALDDSYEGYLELTAGQVATAIANARAYEEERRRAEALAELDRTKTAFFSNVSHEFRTPLTLMLGPIEDLLREQAWGTEQRERLEIVRRNGLRMLKLVNTLLEFSRIEAGRAQAQYEPTDLAALTTDLAGAFRSAIEHAGLRLVVDCPPLPEPVYVDREMWEQVVLNLLSNALKFTFKGEIGVTLRPVGDSIELTVRDTGIGIPESELSHLFERFHQIRDARGRTSEGSGIGLALIQELVRLHGGAIRVSSVLGAGSAFSVTIPTGSAHLPAEQVGAARALTPTALGAAPYVEEALRWLPEHDRTEVKGLSTEQASALDTQSSTLSPQSSARILLADDNADMRAYLSRLLSQRWLVEAVADGSAALAAARARPPDLVLADVMMPGMDGFELLRELRVDARTRNVPIVLLSARAGEESRVEGLKAGADDYLVKPFSARELLARIGAHLDLARERRNALESRQEHANRLRKLAEAGLAINSTLSLDDTLKLVTEQARDIVGAHQAITSMTAAGTWAQAITAIDLSDKYASWRSYQPASDSIGIDSLVRDQNHPLRLTQAELESHPAWQGLGVEAGRRLPMRGWLAAPLIARDGRNIGLIQLSDKYAGEFTEEDEAVLVQLAHMASVAIENARLYQEARGAAQAREELLSVVSHDLKNPLASIKGYAQLLRRRIERLAIPEATRLVDSLTKIDTASARMVGQIDELLDAARLSAGQPLDLSFERIDLVALIRQVATE